jgi:hypothetical protein
MIEPGDRELNDRFRAERRADEQWAPSFDRVVERRPVAARGRRRAWVPVVALAGAAAIAVAIVIQRRDPIPPLVRVTVGALRGPTDFLLNVQGAELLSSVPEVGRPAGWYPLNRTPRRNGGGS